MVSGKLSVARWRFVVASRGLGVLSDFFNRPHHVNRSAVVSGSLPGGAAGQTQEGHANTKAPGAKHQLDDTGRDQRHPKDQSGTVDARGVEGTLVGDAGVADGVGEAAVGQEAAAAVDDGPHRRHQEPHGRRQRHEGRHQADGEKRPRQASALLVFRQDNSQNADNNAHQAGGQSHHVGDGVLHGPGLLVEVNVSEHHAVHQRTQ